MNFRVLGLLMALFVLPFAPAGAEEDYAAGIDYERVSPPMTTKEPGKVEVHEFFWYGCPHCYRFEPHLQQWLEQKPDNVEFTRVPAIFNNPDWELHARAYYTAELLGALDRVHDPLFDAIHNQRKRLNTRDALRDFFAARGVEPDTFNKTFNSFAVESKIRRARDLTKRSGIDGVPAMVVDGEYRVSASQAASYKRLIGITDYLATQGAEGND
ncbi:thiol:disulfide interchange protein DsbA/DsbL [Thiohalomonas denitrificans]|uniref:Thiol:disulfide interchange protein n=1 Tax=Thiohalomonas denitrificans TaxID=415747 RepID=A0A1G5QSN9_9GAMM|nr:thiol:disulfide interchange protein DsbA/DsbL [Thiohalomonas denitrificans]SCZ64588.1 thiol:disulfide interchange protein DsbA [Thiohalomonas denitrificans]